MSTDSVSAVPDQIVTPAPGFVVARNEGGRALQSQHGHVLIVVQNLPVPLDRRVWQECLALVRTGREVSVVCPKGPGDPAYQQLDGVHIYKYAPPKPASGLRSYVAEFVLCWLRTARLVRKIYRERPFDVLQACNPPDTYWLLALPYKRRNVRFVFDQHDLCPEVYTSRFDRPSRILLRTLLMLEHMTYRLADELIVTNESYRSVAMRRGRRRRDQVTVVRSGPDTSRMRRSTARPELKRGRRHLACYLGIMGPQDGVDNVLRALDILIHGMGRRDLHVALLGFGDCLDELKALARELLLEDYVTFTGRADGAMIERYLSTADVGLGPDPLNALNDVSTMNKTMEYMAFGLPVVTFDLKETRFSAQEAAVYVQPGDVTGFAAAIAGLLDDPPRRQAMATYGRHRTVEVLDWAIQARAYVGVFDRLLGEGEPVRVPRRPVRRRLPGAEKLTVVIPPDAPQKNLRLPRAQDVTLPS